MELKIFRSNSALELSVWPAKRKVILEIAPAFPDKPKGQPQPGSKLYDYSKKIKISFNAIDMLTFAYALHKHANGETEEYSKMADMAKAKFDEAKAKLSLAQVHLDFTDIKAPFDGIMDRFSARQGSLLDEGDLLTVLSDNSKMWVYFNVPEAEYLNYKEHEKKDSLMKVNLIMANNLMFNYPGVVQTIEADFNNETGNIAFRATFPNPKGLLRHGETGNVQIKQPVKNAMLIPQKATFEVLEKKYVYVVDKDNVVKSREITIAAELPHIFLVQSGLKENDKILLEGLRQVRENEKIEYTFVKPDSVISHLSLYAE